MPIIESAIKRARQNTIRRARLQPVNTLMKTMIRKVELAVKEGNKAEAQKLLPLAHKAVDMAVKKFIIHRKNGDRKKSSLAKMVGSLAKK
ncbi:30S ribosomal protein S20 [Candidatus Peregrinibacteria bacterium]|nr:30S ribosomal protein S20 [Candidatus Peregrinibacteria bacterium]